MVEKRQTKSSLGLESMPRAATRVSPLDVAALGPGRSQSPQARGYGVLPRHLIVVGHDGFYGQQGPVDGQKDRTP